MRFVLGIGLCAVGLLVGATAHAQAPVKVGSRLIRGTQSTRFLYGGAKLRPNQMGPMVLTPCSPVPVKSIETLVETVDRAVAHMTRQETILTDMTDLPARNVRKEYRFVRSAGTIDEKLKLLEVQVGPLSPRNPITLGTLNETRTTYSLPIDVVARNPQTGAMEVQVANYRVRQHRVVDAETGVLIRRAGMTENGHFVEIKIDHGGEHGVITKHQLLVADQDITALRDPHAVLDDVLTRTRKLNPSTPGAVIDDMFRTIVELHRDGQNLAPFVHVAYTRRSYVLELPRQSSIVPVELTIDTHVRYINPTTGELLGVLPADVAVLEVKLPLAHADLAETGILNRFIEDVMATPRVPGYVDGNGKFFHFRAGQYESQVGTLVPRETALGP